MRALIQRVKHAKVEVDGNVIGQIEQGLLVFVGLGKTDTLQTAEKMLKKILAYRIFSDDSDRMNLNVQQVNGGLLLVSQFTLMAETRKGLRPDFGPAMPPDEARELFSQLVAHAKNVYPNVQTGAFGADMQVSLQNDGPVTFMLEFE
ncbi:D-aminoacyl-tRNA deacylase [Alkanindiges illinoisensis]|uniref:D-aminoacyl-tRNA deacylase n=1 Tax=Alkanindiges illinoisensis TaxID=197183 RepID=A0A4Y7XBU4_9GAMM|nr:D-aminoacyl-tRNA deacylase [Alkanindiges illinoisensis]TEU25550.1 D-tyrosyl-tRNA(Tyr) deacylase [Alkanindiges illinoisensis]